MNKVYHYCLFFTAFLCIWSTPVAAQEEAQASLDLQAVVFGLRNVELFIVHQGGEEPIQLPARYRKRGQSLQYRGPADFALYAQYNGKQKRVGNIQIKKGASRGLILVVGAEAEGETRFITRFFDDDLKTFPMEHVRFINLAPRPVAGMYGESRFAIKAGGASDPYPLKEGEALKLKLAAAYEDEVKLKFDSYVFYEPQARVLYLVYEGHEKRKPIKLAPITDYPNRWVESVDM